MTEEQAIRSIQAGLDLSEGYDLVGTGEMGIGNTTSSAAILAVFSGLPVEEIVGRGTGVDDEGLKRKTNVIREAIERRKPDSKNALDVLQKIGGFEIGAIAGLILGAASRSIPIVVDGFIPGGGSDRTAPRPRM
jgi:nicotinate-nucleotide--dimethylbenzimidazole phosphoribosyltransferase